MAKECLHHFISIFTGQSPGCKKKREFLNILNNWLPSCADLCKHGLYLIMQAFFQKKCLVWKYIFRLLQIGYYLMDTLYIVPLLSDSVFNTSGMLAVAVCSWRAFDKTNAMTLASPSLMAVSTIGKFTSVPSIIC